jgi:integrase
MPRVMPRLWHVIGTDILVKINEKSGNAVARLIKSTVDQVVLPAPGLRTVLWDSEVKGFGIRATSTGTKTYILRYRMGGRGTPLRTLTIGKHGSPWTVDQARRKAIELLGQVKAGIDHSAQRAQAVREAREGVAQHEERQFSDMADRWFQRHVKRGKLRSQKDIEGVLRRDLKPAFAGKSLDEITKNLVTTAMDNIGGRSPDAANKAFKWMRQMFNWFIANGSATASPLDKMKMPFPEGKRTRTLKLPELVIVWVALEALPDPFRSFYRMLILLGQRLREVSNLSWAEIDLDTADWVIPAQRTKNGRDHLVPMPEQALEMLIQLQPEVMKRLGPVFTTDGKVGINGFSKLKGRLDEAIEALIETNEHAKTLCPNGVARWVVHDIRRSLATGCQGLSVPIAVTEATLNHASGTRGGLVQIYQLHDYYDEKADALERWADLIEAALAAWRTGNLEDIRRLDPSRRTPRRRRTQPAKP